MIRISDFVIWIIFWIIYSAINHWNPTIGYWLKYILIAFAIIIIYFGSKESNKNKEVKTMCEYCGCQICFRTAYTCSKCGGVFCIDHRLPEEHNCTSQLVRSWPNYCENIKRFNDDKIRGKR